MHMRGFNIRCHINRHSIQKNVPTCLAVILKLSTVTFALKYSIQASMLLL
ncbi:unnamed protein product [Acanthoscelides obtectus]|uniref:Uncharacterized protein n=1 Tax=Acanthoscelides obtectus TaxID=200917 RepID=A0A9P0PU92_ACAOB|nr:unnamed protein product [Acanthoscelides obtectus]CAK1627563.1 hypothetical protein AOBTE_LOCUS4662 [Acanthoscelides obtectus]